MQYPKVECLESSRVGGKKNVHRYSGNYYTAFNNGLATVQFLEKTKVGPTKHYTINTPPMKIILMRITGQTLSLITKVDDLSPIIQQNP